MKVLMICFISLVVTVTYALKKPHYDLNDAPALFEKFVKDYNRHYKDEADRQVHYEAFVQSLKEINKANAGHSSAVFDINLFADYTKEEQKNHLGFLVDNHVTMHCALEKPYYDLKDAPALFEKFVKDYDRHYKSKADRQVHYEAFVNTLQVINKANAEEPSAVFDINLFADYTEEEQKHHLGFVENNHGVKVNL